VVRLRGGRLEGKDEKRKLCEVDIEPRRWLRGPGKIVQAKPQVAVREHLEGVGYSVPVETLSIRSSKELSQKLHELLGEFLDDAPVKIWKCHGRTFRPGAKRCASAAEAPVEPVDDEWNPTGNLGHEYLAYQVARDRGLAQIWIRDGIKLGE